MTGVIDSLKQKAREWAAMVVDLHNLQVPAKFQSKKDLLMENALKIKTAIESVTGVMPELAPVSAQLGLGVVPIVIGVVGVGAAAAYISYWIYQYKELKAEIETEKKLDQTFNKLVSQGTDPQTASNIVTQMYNKQKQSATVNSIMKGLIPLALIGAGYYYFVKRAR